MREANVGLLPRFCWAHLLWGWGTPTLAATILTQRVSWPDYITKWYGLTGLPLPWPWNGNTALIMAVRQHELNCWANCARANIQRRDGSFSIIWIVIRENNCWIVKISPLQVLTTFVLRGLCSEWLDYFIMAPDCHGGLVLWQFILRISLSSDKDILACALLLGQSSCLLWF